MNSRSTFEEIPMLSDESKACARSRLKRSVHTGEPEFSRKMMVCSPDEALRWVAAQKHLRGLNARKPRARKVYIFLPTTTHRKNVTKLIKIPKSIANLDAHYILTLSMRKEQVDLDLQLLVHRLGNTLSRSGRNRDKETASPQPSRHAQHLVPFR